MHFPVPKGATRQLERDFAKECSDGTREDGFKLEEGRFRLDLNMWDWCAHSSALPEKPSLNSSVLWTGCLSGRSGMPCYQHWDAV